MRVVYVSLCCASVWCVCVVSVCLCHVRVCGATCISLSVCVVSATSPGCVVCVSVLVLCGDPLFSACMCLWG